MDERAEACALLPVYSTKTDKEILMATVIERIPCPSQLAFERDYLRPGRPVIIEGALRGCRACTWTVDYLTSVIGTKKIEVAKSLGVFGYNEQGTQYTHDELSFGEAAARMRSPTSDAKYYAMQMAIDSLFPELINDIALPSFLNKDELLATNLWVGPTGCVTPLHYDVSNNILWQAHGVKRVTVAAPSDTGTLYPWSPLSAFSHVSQVDIDAPDRVLFPRFDGGVLTSVLLTAGEGLFLPAFWWHHVSTVELSISINFWWKTLIPQYFVPNALSQLVAAYDRDRLNLIVDGCGRGGLLDVARFALEKRHSWVACLCAAAAFDRHARTSLARADIDAAALPGRLDTLASALATKCGRRDVPRDSAALWSQLVASARRGNDDRLDADRVRHMVAEVARFVAET